MKTKIRTVACMCVCSPANPSPSHYHSSFPGLTAGIISQKGINTVLLPQPSNCSKERYKSYMMRKGWNLCIRTEFFWMIDSDEGWNIAIR